MKLHVSYMHVHVRAVGTLSDHQTNCGYASAESSYLLIGTIGSIGGLQYNTAWDHNVTLVSRDQDVLSIDLVGTSVQVMSDCEWRRYIRVYKTDLTP